ncbi:MAG: hypothetical protein HY854_18370 [Burkholderiales bacterium]|nr:hypothetical protein [Burkholderiales bacterium]
MLPFTHAQFLDVFATYNAAVWPSQVVAYAVAAAMLASLALAGPSLRSRLVAGGLGVMWLWSGIAYHWLQFTALNQAAWAFGALFVAQGLVFIFAAVRGTLRFDAPAPPASRWVGWGLVAYAMLLYPVLGQALGPGYPRIPMFGITPCPVTLFTFGTLLLASGPVSRWLLAIPVIWSLVGGSAAFLLQVPQDWVLLVSGASVFMIARTGRTISDGDAHAPAHVPHHA